MRLLKLMAMDEEDLAIVSAYMQDAVVRPADIDYRAGEERLVLAANRFVWEKARGRPGRGYQRRRSVLHFNRVGAVRSRGVRRDDAQAVLSLLAIRFAAGENTPGGRIELVFAGEAAVDLDVECIEAQLTDLGAAWATAQRPAHPAGDPPDRFPPGK